MRDTCRSCAYWSRYYSDEPSRGDCRRHAPIRVRGDLRRWPTTREHDWCGDYISEFAEHGNVIHGERDNS